MPHKIPIEHYMTEVVLKKKAEDRVDSAISERDEAREKVELEVRLREKAETELQREKALSAFQARTLQVLNTAPINCTNVENLSTYLRNEGLVGLADAAGIDEPLFSEEKISNENNKYTISLNEGHVTFSLSTADKRDITDLLERAHSFIDRANQNALNYDRFQVDGLTGLNNVRRFWELLVSEISTACRASRVTRDDLIAYRAGEKDELTLTRSFGTLFFDMDKFKALNDGAGHPAGDRALKLVADTLRRPDVLREGDHKARYGGDEFVVIVPRVKKKIMGDLGVKVSTAINHALNENVESRRYNVTTSTGTYFFPIEIGEKYNEAFNRLVTRPQFRENFLHHWGYAKDSDIEQLEKDDHGFPFKLFAYMTLAIVDKKMMRVKKSSKRAEKVSVDYSR